MAIQQVVFLKPQTRLTSVRDRELENSLARSHASRFAHERLQAKRGSPRGSASSSPSTGGESVEERQKDAAPLPLTILRKGNSDPFASHSVEITPRINEIIAFFGAYYVPIAHQPHTFSSFSSDIEQKTVIHALQHSASAPAFILHLLTLMANQPSSSSKDFKQIQLEVRNQTLLSLRSNIHLALASPYSDAVLTAIKFMFMGAAFDGNLAEAKLHGTMLSNLLYRKWRSEKQTLDLSLLLHAIYVDGQLATKHLTLTIFDMTWVEEVLAPTLAEVDEWL